MDIKEPRLNKLLKKTKNLAVKCTAQLLRKNFAQIILL